MFSLTFRSTKALGVISHNRHFTEKRAVHQVSASILFNLMFSEEGRTALWVNMHVLMVKIHALICKHVRLNVEGVFDKIA